MKLFLFIFIFTFVNVGSHADESTGTIITGNLLTEFEPATFLENLAPPTVPPTTISVPMDVANGHEWRGSRCGITKRGSIVFHDNETWTIFWQKAMAPYSVRFRKTPDVDFNVDMVVAVFRGQQDTPNFEVKILAPIMTPADTELNIQYKDIDRLVGLTTPRFSVQPFHLVRLPKFNGPIYFRRVNK